jgi:mRNA interferase MazF
MPIKHFPRVGQILICDFSPSFKEPEMVKRRPVLVVADVFKGRGRVLTVGFHRLDAIQLGTRDQRGKREYFKQRLGRERMRDVYACILHGLNLSEIAQLIRKA